MESYNIMALNKTLLAHKGEAMESSQEILRLKLILDTYKMSILFYL